MSKRGKDLMETRDSGGVTELGRSIEQGRQFHQMLLPSTHRKLLIEFCEKEQRGRRR